MVTDPVCGMSVDPARGAGRHELGGTKYYFCSQHCLAKFSENPEQFLKQPSRHDGIGTVLRCTA